MDVLILSLIDEIYGTNPSSPTLSACHRVWACAMNRAGGCGGGDGVVHSTPFRLIAILTLLAL